MNTLKLKAFALAAATGSFTKASERLFRSQPAVSRMIADLEARWGVPLFERTASGLRLTGAGERLYPRVREWLLCEEALGQEVSGLTGLAAGTLRIATVSSIATYWLPPVLKEFRSLYPGIEYELLLGDYTEIERWVQEGRADCALAPGLKTPGLTCLPVGLDRLLAVLPPGSPLAAKASLTLPDLCAVPFLMLTRGGRSEVAELFERHGLSPRIELSTWDDYAVMSMVEQGLGCSILSGLILQRRPFRVEVRELAEAPCRELFLLMREKERLPPVAKRFLAVFSAYGGRLPAFSGVPGAQN